MSLAVDIRHQAGAFSLEARFETAGRLTALFGPSGSGKTMLVNLIGGLLKPSDGSISVEGRVLVDRARRIFVPPHKRRIGYVFQDARLFPHLTVRQNLRFGRFFASREGRWADEGAIVDLLGIGHLLERRPALLSGGEKSRVAIGRALLASPRLLLMDEPLAALDENRKREILPFIERLRDELRVPVVYVSHSAAEVARLATDVVVLSQGRVTASGPAETILSRLDLLPPGEEGEGGALITLEAVEALPEWNLTRLRSAAGEWQLGGVSLKSGERVRVRVRARDVMLARTKPEQSSALNVLRGIVSEIAPASEADVLVTLDCNGERVHARVTRFSAQSLAIEPGVEVFAIVKAVSLDRAGMAPRAVVPA
ncbi:MAG: molybdenum ABC transporter ATP-binding protein [Mesorhizobium amorphae]|nr:MAG: molybdenum ABC transporter ATP-binding protein [Mesorhizobium amorphae]